MPDVRLVPVDHDPFDEETQQPFAVPVDYDPFAEPAARPTSTTMGRYASAVGKHVGNELRRIYKAFTLPGDVAAGRVDPTSDEAIGRATDLATRVTGGGIATGAEEGAAGMGIRAYHGSPHDFDRFDTSKIGTGEGAQVYGHGLYMAENPSTAQSYKPAGGHSYEVGIGAPPEHFLDWDKPLSQQHPAVQEKLESAFKDWTPNAVKKIKENDSVEHLVKSEPEQTASDLWNAGIPGVKYKDAGSRNLPSTPTKIVETPTLGGFQVRSPDETSIYHHVDTREEAEALAHSMANPPQTHNYVVFNDKIIDILKKYGFAGLVAAGAAHYKATQVDHDPFVEAQQQ